MPFGAGMEETLDKDQALERVEQHIENAIAALPDSVQPEARGAIDGASCDDPTDNGPKNRVTVSHRYWLRNLPSENNDQYVETLHDYWTSNGYRVRYDRRPEKNSISVDNEEDSFGMWVRESKQGYLSIGASSPCIWPEGTPEPE
jgi:hypothetical protein